MKLSLALPLGATACLFLLSLLLPRSLLLLLQIYCTWYRYCNFQSTTAVRWSNCLSLRCDGCLCCC